MRQIKLLAAVFLIVFCFIFFLRNYDVLSPSLVLTFGLSSDMWSSPPAPIWLIVILAFCFGFIVGIVYDIFATVGNFRRNAAMMMTIKGLRQEVSSLRNELEKESESGKEN
jgi:hypothetical protein